MCSGVSFALAVLTLCASIGGFLFGYDTGVVSGAVVFIEGDLGISSLQVEVVVSVTVGSAALGSLLSGVPMQRYGRRPVIMLASALFAAGSLVIAAAPGFGALLAGRLVLGFGVGVSSMVVPVYIAEAAPLPDAVAPGAAGVCGGAVRWTASSSPPSAWTPLPVLSVREPAAAARASSIWPPAAPTPSRPRPGCGWRSGR